VCFQCQKEEEEEEEEEVVEISVIRWVETTLAG